ncbi:hypothetical protein KAI78_00455 [bacterium]|nr:hypothetical protein [bacterium]
MLKEFITFLISEGQVKAKGRKALTWEKLEGLLSEERLIFYQSIFFGKPYSVKFSFGDEEHSLLRSHSKELFINNLIIPVKTAAGPVMVCYNYGKLMDNDAINLFNIPETEVLLVPASEIKKRLSELFPETMIELKAPGLTIRDVRIDITGISLLHYTLGLLRKRTDEIRILPAAEGSILSFNDIQRYFPIPFYAVQLRFEAFVDSQKSYPPDIIPLKGGGSLAFSINKGMIGIFKCSVKSFLKLFTGEKTFFYVSRASDMCKLNIEAEMAQQLNNSTPRHLQMKFLTLNDFIDRQFSQGTIIGYYHSMNSEDIERVKAHLRSKMRVSFKEVRL